jgi:hypothetical protein
MAVHHVRKWCMEWSREYDGWTKEWAAFHFCWSCSGYWCNRASRRVSVVQLELRLNLSWGTIWDTVHEGLGSRKVFSRWVPRHLTDEHKQTIVELSLMLLPHYEEYGDACYAELLQEMRLGSSTTPQRSRLNRWPVSIPNLKSRKFKTVLSRSQMMATISGMFTEFWWLISHLAVRQ